jgi:hypothetical protein
MSLSTSATSRTPGSAGTRRARRARCGLDYDAERHPRLCFARRARAGAVQTRGRRQRLLVASMSDRGPRWWLVALRQFRFRSFACHSHERRGNAAASEGAVAGLDDGDRHGPALAEADALGDVDRLPVPGGVCQAVDAPGVKSTFAAANAEVRGGRRRRRVEGVGAGVAMSSSTYEDGPRPQAPSAADLRVGVAAPVARRRGGARRDAGLLELLGRRELRRAVRRDGRRTGRCRVGGGDGAARRNGRRRRDGRGCRQGQQTADGTKAAEPSHADLLSPRTFCPSGSAHGRSRAGRCHQRC